MNVATVYVANIIQHSKTTQQQKKRWKPGKQRQVCLTLAYSCSHLCLEVLAIVHAYSLSEEGRPRSEFQ